MSHRTEEQIHEGLSEGRVPGRGDDGAGVGHRRVALLGRPAGLFDPACLGRGNCRTTRAYHFPYFAQCAPKSTSSSGSTGSMGLATHVVLMKCFQVMFSLAMLPPHVPQPKVSEKGIPLM